jgi:hypothetical protein
VPSDGKVTNFMSAIVHHISVTIRVYNHEGIPRFFRGKYRTEGIYLTYGQGREASYSRRLETGESRVVQSTWAAKLVGIGIDVRRAKG